MISYLAEVQNDGFVDVIMVVELPTESYPTPINGGTLVEVSGPAGACPSTTSKLKLVEGELVWAETLSLSEIKAAKTAEITAERLLVDGDHFVYGGKSIRTADKDIFDMLIANSRITMSNSLPSNWPGGWKTIDNSYIPISSVSEWNSFFITMYDTGINNFYHSQSLKSAIANATTIAEVQAIVW